MPERPDLEYAIPILNKSLVGTEIVSAELHKPTVLRLAIPGALAEILQGVRIQKLRRHLHFVCIDTSSESTEIVIAPMLAGSLSVHPASEGKKKGRALTWHLADGREFRYRDSVSMGKVYVIPKARYDLIPGYEKVGVDVLNPEVFTLAKFSALAKKRRDQVKVFLLDKGALDSFGNAYADEALFCAGIHPKTFVRNLGEDEIERLHVAIPQVLREANEVLRVRAPATDEKVRDFLKVRNRHKTPCVECETPIRKTGVRGFDAFFCPKCQPETRKSGIVSWSRPT